MNVTIDVDTGTDDAIALIMALNSPELHVGAITTVAGNASLSDTTRNTLRLLGHLGRSDIPVARGAPQPIEGQFDFAYNYHGAGGLTTELPVTEAEPIESPASHYLQTAALGNPEDLTIIALGPLTNIALAFNSDPRFKSRIGHLYVMGGAVEVSGNVTPFAEFNIHSDPLAANVVFNSGVPITLIGLDVGDRVGFDRTGADWNSGESRGENLAARIIRGWFDIHPDRDRYVLCDPITIAAAVAPDLFEFRWGRVTVDETGETRGRTRATYGPGNVMIALTVDENQARLLVLDRLRTPNA